MCFDKVLMVTKEEQKAIKNTFNRSEEQINEDVKIIKEWLRKQPHLPQDEDENRIRNILQFNKFSLEKTKKKLDMYYSLKNVLPEFYTDREPQNALLSKQMDDLVMMPLPNLTPDLCRLFFFKLWDNDSSKFNVPVYVKLFYGIIDVCMVRDSHVGERFLVDMEHVTLGHLVHLTPAYVKKTYDLMQKSYSDKIKGMHFINLPPGTSFIINIFNAILSQKMANRIHVHENIESVLKILSPKVLPNEYGGTAGPVKKLYDEWKKCYRSKNDWLKKEALRTSDESKRIGEPLDTDMFGVGGSFRKLNVD